MKEEREKVEEKEVKVEMRGTLTIQEYRTRLISHKKELYKDPPVLPVLASLLEEKKPVPTRDKATGRLKFADYPNFQPNLTPREILRRGSFGGTYFRTIHSAVLNQTIPWKTALKDIPSEWIEGLDRATYLTSDRYQPRVNKFKVKSGGSLGMWESSGWISNLDPYGWFQWYCRFYLGRRTTDDARQISRALGVMGPKGRFRNQLINNVLTTGKNFDDSSVSPVIRQSLQHWGYELTEGDVKEYARMKGVA